MQLKVKILKLLAGKPISILNFSTATKMNVHVGERIIVSKDKMNIISIVDTAKGLIKEDEIAVSNELVQALNLNENDSVEVSLAEKPESTLFIRKKIEGKTLEKKEIEAIIKDVVNNALTEAEIAYFISAVYKNGMDDDEIENLIKAMVATGTRLNFAGRVVDKHSIGGLGANRTTPIVVPICTAAGLTMPKTSSRAITSAAGTADVIESIASVEFSVEEMKAIVRKTKGCIVWNGILGLSPADDKLIQVERVLNLDPEPQLLASVLSKKISVGSKYVIIDIPYGKSAKVDKKRGILLKKKFEKLAKKFSIKLRCVLTRGDEPIGRGIGPLLEIRDILCVLKRQNSPLDLENKAIFLAGQIFELCGAVRKGKGEILARDILDSGKAYEKFKEIIEAQHGHVPTIEEIEQRLGKFRKDIIATKHSTIKEINNKKISLIATIAGSPMDKGSGIYLYKHLNDNVEKGEKILTIYSDSEIRLKNALELYNKIQPVVY